jgi:hypothetical protein
VSSSCGSGGCGGYGSSSGGTVVVTSAASYPNCQCDWLFNDAGQGNCNIGASSHTADRYTTKCFLNFESFISNYFLNAYRKTSKQRVSCMVVERVY